MTKKIRMNARKARDKEKDVEFEELKIEYAAARKKYDLPPFDAFDTEFELRRTGTEGFVARRACRAILNKIDFGMNLLQPVLEPEPHSLHAMIEMSALKEGARKNVSKHFRELGVFFHEGAEAIFRGEKASAEFVKSTWKTWPALKKALLKDLSMITDTWREKKKTEIEKKTYFG